MGESAGRGWQTQKNKNVFILRVTFRLRVAFNLVIHSIVFAGNHGQEGSHTWL